MSSKSHGRSVYWDSCIFFAWIKQETCWPEDIIKGIEQTIEQTYAKRIVIVTSVATLTEILQSQMKPEDKDRYQKLFGHPQLQLMDVDRRIAAQAAVIREYYDTRAFDVQPDGTVVKTGSVMSLGDSFHLATALHYDVDEFQTLDGAGKRKRRVDLLKLNGSVAGFRLVIIQPKYVPPPEPLPGPVSPTVSGAQQSLDLAGTNEAKDEGGVSGSQPNNVSDLVPVEGGKEYAEPKATDTGTVEVQRGSDGSPGDKAGAEAAEDRGNGKEAAEPYTSFPWEINCE
jgi:hypothetical protein